MIKYFLNRDTQTINSLTSTLAACVLWAFAFVANAASDTFQLQPFEAEYTGIRWGNNVGTATLKLEHLAANTYSLTYFSKAKVFFYSDKRKEHSIFSFNDGHFTPKEYYYSRTGTGSDKSLELAFNAKQQQIEVKDGEAMEWLGEWDNQLYRLDIPQKLANGEGDISYDFINSRGEKRKYRIIVEGSETLSLPYGMIEAIKVKIARESKKRVTYAWFAPELHYNMVRLQQFKNGDEQGDVQLKAFRVL